MKPPKTRPEFCNHFACHRAVQKPKNTCHVRAFGSTQILSIRHIGWDRASGLTGTARSFTVAIHALKLRRPEFCFGQEMVKVVVKVYQPFEGHDPCSII